MPKFHYVATKQTPRGISEESGIIESPTIDLAMIMLISGGFVVRDLHSAKPEECEIERLKKIRSRLDPPLTVINTVQQESKLPYMILVFVVIVLIVMYFSVRR